MTEIRQAYLEYNKRYFGGRLPKNCRVRWTRKIRGYLGHQCWLKNDTPLIEISTKCRSSRRTWRLTLLHEMVHLFLPRRFNHGPRFEREMLRLAKMDAFRGIW